MPSNESLLLRAWRAVAFAGHHARIARLYDDRADAVLRYHSVGGGFYDSIPPERFRRDVEYLQRNHEIVDLPEVLGPGSADRVALTFDDGYRDFHRNVLPILREYDVPATVFVIADAVDDRSFVHNDKYDYEYMDRSELADLADEPLVTVGNHSRSHPDLSELSRAELEREIVGAQRDLEELLGTEVRRFCYPFCDPEPRAAAVVRESHDIGVAAQGRRQTITAETDPATVPRINGANPPWEVRWDLSAPARRLGAACDRFLGSDSADQPARQPAPADDPVADGTEQGDPLGDVPRTP